MANEQNLKPFTSDQSREEAVKNGRKGGIASGEAKRERKAMREQLEMLLSLGVKDAEAKQKLEALGINPDETNNQMALLVAMLGEGLNGNVKAFTAIRDTVGEMPILKQDVNVTESPKLSDVIGQLGGAGLEDDD